MWLSDCAAPCCSFLRHLTCKSRKTALLQFQDISQLLASLKPRIKQLIKEGGDFLPKAAALLGQLKRQAQEDLNSFEHSLNKPSVQDAPPDSKTSRKSGPSVKCLLVPKSKVPDDATTIQATEDGDREDATTAVLGGRAQLAGDLSSEDEQEPDGFKSIMDNEADLFKNPRFQPPLAIENEKKPDEYTS